MQAAGAIGALNKADVQQRFLGAMPEVGKCLDKARRRLPYLGGDIDVFLRINQMGKASTAYFLRSTLGDHRAEACILDVFRAQQWPRPVGGKVGESTQSFSFDPDPDVAPPRLVSTEQLAAAMDEDDSGGTDSEGEPSAFRQLLGQLGRCRAEVEARRLDVTVYLDEDGMIEGMGLVAPNDRGTLPVQCVETVVKTTSFPSMADGVAKLSIRVQ